MLRLMLAWALALSAMAADIASADDLAIGSGIEVDGNGRLVRVDPELRASLAAQLHTALLANGTAPHSSEVRVLADGAQAMTLGAEHATILMLRVAGDGDVETQCVLGVDAAASYLAESPVTAPESAAEAP